MPTIESLKEFLVDQHRQGFLPSDPSFLFTRGFLENLVAFMDGNGAGQPSCPRCDVVMDGLGRHVEILQVWHRFLQGGRAQ